MDHPQANLLTPPETPVYWKSPSGAKNGILCWRLPWRAAETLLRRGRLRNDRLAVWHQRVPESACCSGSVENEDATKRINHTSLAVPRTAAPWVARAAGRFKREQHLRRRLRQRLSSPVSGPSEPPVLLLVLNDLLNRSDIVGPNFAEPLLIAFFDEHRKWDFPRLLIVIRLAPKSLRVHPQLSSHLNLGVGKVELFASINPDLVLWRECLLGHFVSSSEIRLQVLLQRLRGEEH